jgi:hypothetical protein
MRTVALILQIALHIFVAIVASHGMGDSVTRWEFWAVMLSLPAIRAVDACCYGE